MVWLCLVTFEKQELEKAKAAMYDTCRVANEKQKTIDNLERNIEETGKDIQIGKVAYHPK